MWTIDATDFALLRGGGGQPFTRFVNSLIRVHAFVNGIGEASLDTTIRVNVRDGGVDAQVSEAMPTDTTGYLLVPSCWQYKAVEAKDISDADLRNEIGKYYAQDLIAKGYGYRLAVCGELSPVKKEEWQTLLTGLSRTTNAQSPPAFVISASDLAAWANSYPAMLPAHFRSEVPSVLYFDSWTRNVTAVTPEFVQVEERSAATHRIERHLDPTIQPIQPTLSIQGLAGVGKTRLVYEVVARAGASRHLVLYAPDGERAEELATSLANDPRTSCILVADECTVSSRLRIANTLKGHARRVRVVCIDNSGERPIGGEEELRLDELPSSNVEEVLARNFPRVPNDRRRAYADLSRGYIRFAADMCEQDAQIAAMGHVGPALPLVQDYYRNRFPEKEKREVIEALSLFQRIGYAEGVSGELDALCALTELKRGQFLQIANGLRDAPGFVARTTRYLYVTPEIVARVAFECAWRRWIRSDHAAFLSAIPAALLKSFLNRVARSASAEVSALVGTFFWQSALNLSPANLENDEDVSRLATLVDIEPDRYFPKFASLVSSASPEQLRQTGGGLGKGGTRRTLVWTAERFAAFPQYFSQAEAILRHLAVTETEKGIGNNATGVWKELFRIQISGTATPFAERIRLLKELFETNNAAYHGLVMEALREALNHTGTRLVGPSVVGGQLVPPDWRPRSFDEFRQCLLQILGVIEHVVVNGALEIKRTAWRNIAQHLRFLLSNQLLEQLKELVQKNPVPADVLPNILSSIDDFLEYECDRSSDAPSNDPNCGAVSEWLHQLIPSNFEDRIRAVIGKDYWHHSMREDISKRPSEIAPLALEIMADPAKLSTVLPFLSSSSASSAGLLGRELGRIDSNGHFLDEIVSDAVKTGSTAFASGYVSELIGKYPGISSRLNDWLDRLEVASPILAHYLGLAAPGATEPIGRSLRLVSMQRLDVHLLEHFQPGIFLFNMTSRELCTVLDMLVAAGDAPSIHIATDFIGHCVQSERPFQAEEREAVWRVLDAGASIDDRAHYWWTKAVETFSADNPEHALRTAIQALLGDDYDKQNSAWDVLSLLARSPWAQSHANVIMSALGELLLNTEESWRLRTGPKTGFFGILPEAVIENWLSQHGIDGARALANYLPTPALDNGAPSVHPLTQLVLANWGEDQDVFNRFVASTHHLRLYAGDIAATHRRDAETAKRFLSHQIPAIRKWAEIEVALGERQARDWTVHMEEHYM